MKIVAALLLFTTKSLVSTEFSPSFSNNQFKNQPQTIYGPPQLPRIQTAPFRPFPQKQTLPDTYGPPSREAGAQQVSPNSWRVIQGVRSPQTSYGAPSKQTGNFLHVNSPQTSYGPPNRQVSSPQISLGQTGPFWQTSNGINAPQATFGSPPRQTWPNGVNALQSTYETLPRQVPNRFNAPLNTYRAPARQTLDPRRVPTTPQTQNVNSWQPLGHQTYRAPERQNSQVSQSSARLPQTQYGSPDTNNVETLERLRALTSIGSQSLPLRPSGVFKAQPQPQALPEPREQYLPSRDSIDFRSAPSWNQDTQRNDLDLPLPKLESDVEVQKLELKTLYPPLGDGGVQGNARNVELDGKNVNNADYLPVTTTAVPVLKKPTRTTPRPVTTPKSDEGNQQDAGDPEEETGEQPNVAIATAVSGGVGAPGEQQFYLLQPDGRLQKVVYQKTRQEGDAADEYTVDYRFHNIQGDPNSVYAPLVTLG